MTFEQRDSKNLIDVWTRFKRKVKRCPHHCILECVLMEQFYFGLSEDTQQSADTMFTGQLTSDISNRPKRSLPSNTIVSNKARDPQGSGEHVARRAMQRSVSFGDELQSFVAPLDLGCALCDLGASINLMPHFIFKKLEIGDIQQTHMRLQFADRSIACQEDEIEDVLGKLTMHFNNEEIKFNVVNAMKLSVDVENYNTIESLG
ncbi:uncharacterized protein E5676_scaffold368G00040 [Cucumis melo var. makuwa]|uniref:Uncharacterized protein n=1 Tax=Cucumis melo var. makuwa TaxID=1194695 RepID=A0A5D3D677_CUCMM|nr:uncharacterized protein E6C27_scaffold163G001290 [Cucumis melo var. makuwa]TYK19035.1 uncharacterized protein E5676_scaffold368G00040 [Cucumis melo var. makuwa]